MVCPIPDFTHKEKIYKLDLGNAGTFLKQQIIYKIFESPLTFY